MVIQTNYSRGYIVEYEKICFDSWLLLPAENFWPSWLRGLFYTLAMLYLFLGIAIVADVFMLSIEMITSKKRIIFTFDYDRKERVEREVFIWNETIANLTLMALGSSAPEILIAVIETVSNIDNTVSSDGLGVFTIIGSAAYNLLVITAVCVMTVPSPMTKRINEFGVFVITSLWSMFAYVWLLVVLRWSSPNEIEIWEAVLTLLYFPFLVVTAWIQDKGWWFRTCKTYRDPGSSKQTSSTEESSFSTQYFVNTYSSHSNNKKFTEVSITSPSKKMSQMKVKQLAKTPSKIRDIVTYVKENQPNQQLSATDLVWGLREHFNSSMAKSFARARFRHAVILNITGQKKSNDCPKGNLISKAMQGQTRQGIILNRDIASSVELSGIKDYTSGTFCFSSSTYSVSRQAKLIEVDVLFNRNITDQKVGFSHVVDATRRLSQIPSNCSLLQQYNDICHTNHVPLHNKSNMPEVSVSDVLHKDRFNKNTNTKETRSSPFSTNVLQNKNSWDHNLQTINYATNILNIENIPESPGVNSIVELENINVVHYETRERNAKRKKDFLESSGKLVFSRNEFSKRIVIPVLYNNENMDGCQKDFYVVLKDASFDTKLGDPSIAHITFVDDNEPGEVIFQEPTYHVDYLTHNIASAMAKVVRLRGVNGKVSVFYRTINGTANGGDKEDLNSGKCDFVHTEQGVLKFAAGETTKKISVKVNPNAEKGKTFIIALYHVTGSAKIGHRCATIISLTSEVDEIVNEVTSIVNKESTNISVKREWRQQFVDAMSIEETSSFGAMLLHFLCFLWKVLFSFIPPRTVWGGWAAFVVSLIILGILSAFVEQFAKLLGCVVGLHVSITGITFVALGTSMPDTFASKTAATFDDSADAAIGNITGSNSVNVFLGLGLPWVLKSIYLHWKNDSKLILKDNNLYFSVLLFLSCGMSALVILVVRRTFLEGELGGSSTSKYASGFIMIFLWLLFVMLCSFQAYGIINVL